MLEEKEPLTNERPDQDYDTSLAEKAQELLTAGEARDKKYVMVRESGNALAYVVDRDGRRELPHVIRHSPAGCEWGYGGSGPADLARSILADAVGIGLADRFYQDFKWCFVALLPYAGGVIAVSQVRRFLESKGVRLA